MAEELFRFRNTTQGHVGAIKIDRRGDRRSIPVGPGEIVELSEEEQEATARAPRDPGEQPVRAAAVRGARRARRDRRLRGPLPARVGRGR
jgi:hypothetical protein